MDFALNEEQLELKARMRRFARDVIRPVAAEHDAEESTPWEVMQGRTRAGPARASSTCSGWARTPTACSA